MDIDERVRGEEPPEEYVRRLAAEKSARRCDALRSGHGEATTARRRVCCLGADTAVVVDGRDSRQAGDGRRRASMLRRCRAGARGADRCQPSGAAPAGAWAVWRRPPSSSPTEGRGDRLVRPKQERGATRPGPMPIQGLASRFVRRIEGSYSNVVGLPVAAVHQLLKPFAGPGGLP